MVLQFFFKCVFFVIWTFLNFSSELFCSFIFKKKIFHVPLHWAFGLKSFFSLGREIDRYIDSIIFSNEFDVFQRFEGEAQEISKTALCWRVERRGENCVANRSVDAKVGSLNPIWFRHVQKSNSCVLDMFELKTCLDILIPPILT